MLVCLLACVAPSAGAAAADSLFSQGTRLLQQGEYRAALDAYEAVAGVGRASGALYYNMGLAYYSLDELGQGIRYFEKARRYLPHNERLQHNFALARQQTVDQFADLPAPFWLEAWRSVVRNSGDRGIFALGLFFYLAAFGIWGFGMLYRTQGRRHVGLRRASLAIGALLLIAAFAASSERAEPSRAVVLATEAPLRALPEIDSERRELVHEGTLLYLMADDLELGWTKVRLSNGGSGWIPTSAIGAI